MNLTCYNSSHPAALNATVLYPEHHDSQNLWVRNTSLPLCPASYDFIYQCVVCCLDQVVFAVCKNLTVDESIIMEGNGVPISLTRSDCPRADSVHKHSAQLEQSRLYFSAVVVFIIFIALLAFCGWRLYQNKTSGSSRPHEEEEDVLDGGQPV